MFCKRYLERRTVCTSRLVGAGLREKEEIQRFSKLKINFSVLFHRRVDIKEIPVTAQF